MSRGLPSSIWAGTNCETVAAEDQAEIGSLFHGNVQIATAPVPICDILFLYCAFERSGKIAGQGLSLRDLIQKSGASVAVIAREVQDEFMSDREFQKSWLRGRNPPVNLVIVNNRNGKALVVFQVFVSGHVGRDSDAVVLGKARPAGAAAVPGYPGLDLPHGSGPSGVRDRTGVVRDRTAQRGQTATSDRRLVRTFREQPRDIYFASREIVPRHRSRLRHDAVGGVVTGVDDP